MSCCEARATGPSGDVVNVTMENVGGGAEFYVNTSGPNPFQIRTLTSTGSTISITQNAQTIDIDSNVSLSNEGTGADVYDAAGSTATSKLFRRIKSSNATITITQNATDIDIANAVALANEGGFAEFYDTATSTATTKNIRTLKSSDASITVTQNATNIDIKVATPAKTLKEYYEQSTALSTTNNTSYVTLWTSAAITGVVSGETWELECSWLVCQPVGLTTVNNRTRWQLETSAGTFTDLETNISANSPITIAGGERSTPYSRIYEFTASMNTPKVRVGMSMSAAVATGAQWEYPRIRAHKKLGT